MKADRYPEANERKLNAAEEKRFGKEIIPVSYVKKTSGFWNVAGYILPFVVLFLFGQYIVRRSGGGFGGSSAFNFGKSTATLLDKENKSTITFVILQVSKIQDFKNLTARKPGS